MVEDVGQFDRDSGVAELQHVRAEVAGLGLVRQDPHLHAAAMCVEDRSADAVIGDREDADVGGTPALIEPPDDELQASLAGGETSTVFFA